MAYDFIVSGPLVYHFNGIKHIVYTVTETDVEPTSEWHVSIPECCALTLYEAELTDAGDALTINPELGLAAGWTDDTLDEVIQNVGPGTYMREQTSVRITALDSALYGRSCPDATANEVVTRITLQEGHI